MATLSTDDDAKGGNDSKGKANQVANGQGLDGMHFVEWIVCNEATRCKLDHDHHQHHVTSLSAFEGGGCGQRDAATARPEVV